MDEKSLRRAFRDRSRVLHPDVARFQVRTDLDADICVRMHLGIYSCVCICQQSADDLAGVPSVYELNAAFEAVKPLVVKT